MKGKPRQPAGTERGRDEQRDSKTARYGGGPWQVADERGARRFGRARNDDADPSELAPGEADKGDDESPSAADSELAATEDANKIVSSGEVIGMHLGDEPHKAKRRGRGGSHTAKKTSRSKRRKA